MADQNPQHGRRPHFHRGRRGPDRRGNDRRNAPPQDQQQGARDHVDVEQIMREIRARISQRHGIDLSTQQIQELAARRLEAILDPRTVKPSLLEQLRRSAGAPIETTRPVDSSLSYTFEATTLYESPNGFVRFMRRLLQPLVKLFFNPNPLIQAMHTQVRINEAVLAREAERDRRQAEWNALHYEVLQRLVLEISRTSLEGQGLSMRVESLSTKVDFNERRVRGIENTVHQSRPAPAPRPSEAFAATPPTSPPQPREGASAGEPPAGEVAREANRDPNREGSPEGGRRRRRRRRGRRPQMGAPFDGAPQQQGPVDQLAGAPPAGEIDVETDIEEDEEESGVTEGGLEPSSPGPSMESKVTNEVPPEPAFAFDPFAPSATPVAPVHTPSNPDTASSAPGAAPADPAHTPSPDPHDRSDSGQ